MIERLRQLGLTPAKAALMAVLAGALVWVWGPMLLPRTSGQTPNVALAEPRRPAAAPNRAPRTTPPKRVAKRSQPVRPEPPKPRAERPATQLGVDDAVAYDPFAVPAWSPESRTAARTPNESIDDESSIDERFESIKRSGVAMILVSADGHAAQMGNRTIRVGDEVDGFIVTEIHADGVVFEPAETSPEDDGGA